MKVYLEEKDIGRKIFTYNDWQNTQQGLYVYGKDKIEVLSLADYTKQVRKEVCEEIRDKMTHWEDCLTKEVTEYVIDKETLDKIEQGETKCQKN